MKTTFVVAVVSLLCVGAAVGAPAFFEDFSGDWESRWTVSKAKDDFGRLEVTAGDWYNDAAADAGLRTTTDARFYSVSASFPEFSNEGRDLVVQYTVKHPQKIDCGGGYLKLLPAGFDAEAFSGDTTYNIMFGPDICGPPTKKIHFIHHYDGDNHLWKKTPKAETDQLTHLYQFVLRADNTYTVSVDGKEVEKGSLEEDWDLLPPKRINDPAESKPADWVDVKRIADPEDVKPADWDNEPATIADPDAVRPDDWDDDLDGEWEAPMIDNPAYKGEWRAKMIDNPAYKGEWIHPQIDNPEYTPDPTLYRYKSFGGVGIDIWQVKAGSIFDNIWIGTDVAEADQWVAEHLQALRDGEKKMFDAAEEARKAKEKAEREAAEAKRKEEDDKRKADEAAAAAAEGGDDDDAAADEAAADAAGHDEL